LQAFYERVEPFAPADISLFGRKNLPHRSTLSRYLAALDQPVIEALRAQFLDDLSVANSADLPPWWAVGSSRATLAGGRCRRNQTGRKTTCLAQTGRTACSPSAF
jgi:hypothetical protein